MLNLKLYDLVIFRDKYIMVYKDVGLIESLKKEKNLVLNDFVEIAKTNNYTIKLFETGLILAHGNNANTLYDDVEVAGIWRFNNETKNYDLIYNNDLFDMEE